MVFAMRQGHRLARGRNLIIFEAVLPNPEPSRGLQGCAPVAKFWWSLSAETDPLVRSAELERFFFDGIDGFPPVVHADHYGTRLGADGFGCSTGQIRTNQFVGPEWNLREFRLVQDCRCGDCALVIAPTTVKENPLGKLFGPRMVDRNAPDLHATVIDAVPILGIGSIAEVHWGSFPNHLNTGESVAVVNGPYDYLNRFQIGAAIDPTFAVDLARATTAVWGSRLTAEQIVSRAQSQSCAGCHNTSAARDIGDRVEWPRPRGFVHVDETELVQGRFALSEALEKFFLPYRETILLDFLDGGGSSAPVDTECRIPIPRELQFSCSDPAGQNVDLRPFTPSGLEALVPERAPSIGGARVH